MPVVLTPAAVWFGAVVAFAFLFTFDKTFRALFAPLMTRIADIGFGGIRGHGSVHPFGFLNGIVDDVETWTRRQMAACERAMAWAIETMRATAHELSLTVHSMADNYKAAFDNVWHAVTHDAPTIIRQTVVRPVQKAATYSDAKLRAQVHNLTVRVDHLAARAEAIAMPVPHGANWVNERLDRLLRDRSRTRDRLHRIEKLLAVVGFTGLLVAALGRMRLGWLRCPALIRLGNRFGCGGFNFLEALLAVTFEALVITDLCRVVDAMTAVARLFAKELEYLSSQISGLIECQGASRPGALSVAWSEPPPLSVYVET